MESKLEPRVGDVVRVKPLTISEIDVDGDMFFEGYRGLLYIESIESIISRAETPEEKIARLEDELAKAPRWIEWDGEGENCPLKPETKVMVRRRDGSLSLGQASDFWWFSKSDICVSAYMVLPE